METAESRRTDWLQPPPDQQGLKRYVETVRERIWLIVAAVVITTAAASAYVATADKVYEAETEVLVTPISDDAGTLARLGLVTESTDPLRAIETASALIASNAAARLTIERLNLDDDPQGVLEDIRVDPVAESNIVTITARAADPTAAAELADTFARAALQVRTDAFHERIDEELPRLRTRAAGLPRGPTSQALIAQIVELETLRAGSEPTLEIAELATEPSGPVSPRRLASLLAGILAGLILGIGGAFALQVLDPRLRRETQLRDRYRLPILARIPRERGRKGQPLRWEMLSGASIEAYRTLRGIIARPLSRDGAGAILVTSPGPSEGKSTTAISLATSLALAGKRVILIEADLRRPAIGAAMGISVDQGVVKVLIEEATLYDSLIPDPSGNDNLRLLLAEQADWGGELLSLPAAQGLVEEAKLHADYVVVDSPPLATVVDALPLARAVDDILLVVRLGTSHLNRIEELGELLADTGLKPLGFAVIGVPRPRDRDYYDDYRRRMTAEQPARTLAAPRG